MFVSLFVCLNTSISKTTELIETKLGPQPENCPERVLVVLWRRSLAVFHLKRQVEAFSNGAIFLSRESGQVPCRMRSQRYRIGPRARHACMPGCRIIRYARCTNSTRWLLAQSPQTVDQPVEIDHHADVSGAADCWMQVQH